MRKIELFIGNNRLSLTEEQLSNIEDLIFLSGISIRDENHVSSTRLFLQKKSNKKQTIFIFNNGDLN